MKKIDLMIFCTICIIVLFAGCNNAEKQVSSPEFSFDSKGHYSGFKNLPSDYTLEMAKKDGYYVKQDSEVIANESVWEKFIPLWPNSEGKILLGNVTMMYLFIKSFYIYTIRTNRNDIYGTVGT